MKAKKIIIYWIVALCFHIVGSTEDVTESVNSTSSKSTPQTESNATFPTSSAGSIDNTRNSTIPESIVPLSPNRTNTGSTGTNASNIDSVADSKTSTLSSSNGIIVPEASITALSETSTPNASNSTLSSDTVTSASKVTTTASPEDSLSQTTENNSTVTPLTESEDVPLNKSGLPTSPNTDAVKFNDSSITQINSSTVSPGNNLTSNLLSDPSIIRHSNNNVTLPSIITTTTLTVIPKSSEFTSTNSSLTQNSTSDANPQMFNRSELPFIPSASVMKPVTETILLNNSESTTLPDTTHNSTISPIFNSSESPSTDPTIDGEKSSKPITDLIPSIKHNSTEINPGSTVTIISANTISTTTPTTSMASTNAISNSSLPGPTEASIPEKMSTTELPFVNSSTILIDKDNSVLGTSTILPTDVMIPSPNFTTVTIGVSSTPLNYITPTTPASKIPSSPTTTVINDISSQNLHTTPFSTIPTIAPNIEQNTNRIDLLKKIRRNRYKDAVKMSKDITSKNSTLMTEIVIELLTNNEPRIVAFAFKLWNGGARDIVENIFPSPFKLLFGNSSVLLINLAYDQAIKLDARIGRNINKKKYKVRRDNRNDRLAYGDVKNKTSPQVSWKLIPEWQNNKVSFKLYNVHYNMYLKLDYNVDKRGDRQAWGSTRSNQKRHQFELIPVNKKNAVYFIIKNNRYLKPLKLKDEPNDHGDRQLYGRRGYKKDYRQNEKLHWSIVEWD